MTSAIGIDAMRLSNMAQTLMAQTLGP